MFLHRNKYHKGNASVAAGGGDVAIKPWVILLPVLCWFMLLSASGLKAQNLDEIRKEYFSIQEEECNWMNLADKIEDTANPVLLAYRGALFAASANCIDRALNKLKRFKEGREKLEKAVALEPDNTEIRFLRYSVKVKTPGILNYNDAEADKIFIINSLLKGSLRYNAFLLHEICGFMLKHGELNQNEKQIIENIYSETSN